MRFSLWTLLLGAAIWGCAHASHRCGPWHHWRSDYGWRHHRVHDGLAAWLDRAHRRLDITVAQDPAWERFAAAVAEAVRLFDEPELHCASTGGAPGTIERLAEMTRAADEAMRELRPAFDELYAQLDEAQRRRMDRMLGRAWWI